MTDSLPTLVERIFLDLDDTLNSLTLPAMRRAGCKVGDFDYHLYPVEAGYDIVKATMMLSGNEYTVPDFWNLLGRDFWRTLPKSQEFDLIIDSALSLVGPENVCILTSPTKDPDCLAGKLEWIHDNLPKELHRRFLIGPRKHFCAKRGSMLLDDSSDNTRLFREHGGIGLTVPRPWNAHSRIRTEAFLYACFNTLRVFNDVKSGDTYV